jgi:hypothetical protein
MRIVDASSAPFDRGNPTADEADSNGQRNDSYESPLLVELGHVRNLTLGSSASGNADANSQYYW